MKIDKTFILGVSTSAFQIEGAIREDGRGIASCDSIGRDENGKVYKDVGDIACDHYHRYKEDIKLLNELGVDSYRFSIAWTRIIPEGIGEINEKGIAFYNNILDELEKYHIEPMITTWHGDLPAGLANAGGWANEKTVEAYESYVQVLFNAFGCRVKKWITHNEPWCVAYLDSKDEREAIQIAHHLNQAHTKAIRLYRKHQYGDGQIGMTLNLSPAYPATQDEKDLKAARYFNGFFNEWFLDPIIKGHYPEYMIKHFEKRLGDVSFLKDLSYEPMDFLGINYYTRSVVSYDESNFFFNKGIKQEGIHTEMGWEVYPSGLYDTLLMIKEKYDNIPVYITENGAAFKDECIEENRVQDDDRLDYIKRHLQKVLQVKEEGACVEGYYVWSFLDNFEWGLGYSKKFGIIRVDYSTLERSFKKSGLWYKEVNDTRTI